LLPIKTYYSVLNGDPLWFSGKVIRKKTKIRGSHPSSGNPLYREKLRFFFFDALDMHSSTLVFFLKLALCLLEANNVQWTFALAG
jgi:hypothetical protein